MKKNFKQLFGVTDRPVSSHATFTFADPYASAEQVEQSIFVSYGKQHGDMIQKPNSLASLAVTDSLGRQLGQNGSMEKENPELAHNRNLKDSSTSNESDLLSLSISRNLDDLQQPELTLGIRECQGAGLY